MTTRERRNRVLEEWNKFAVLVLPIPCTELQRKEMRRAFYAGASAVFYRLVSDVSPGDSLSNPDDQFMMEDFNAEFNDFNERVKRREA